MQGLQHDHRSHHLGRDRGPATGLEQVGEHRFREQLATMRGQEREHPTRRQQMPGHRLHIQDLALADQPVPAPADPPNPARSTQIRHDPFFRTLLGRVPRILVDGLRDPGWPPARRRPGLVPGVLGPADNAAGGQLGAKTAIKIRGTRPSRPRRRPATSTIEARSLSTSWWGLSTFPPSTVEEEAALQGQAELVERDNPGRPPRCGAWARQGPQAAALHGHRPEHDLLAGWHEAQRGEPARVSSSNSRRSASTSSSPDSASAT